MLPAWPGTPRTGGSGSPGAPARELELLPNRPPRTRSSSTLLSAWNARMNLTALDDRDEAVDRLILEPVGRRRGTAGRRAVPGRRLRRRIARRFP
jgi:hypothetical protein